MRHPDSEFLTQLPSHRSLTLVAVLSANFYLNSPNWITNKFIIHLLNSDNAKATVSQLLITKAFANRLSVDFRYGYSTLHVKMIDRRPGLVKAPLH